MLDFKPLTTADYQELKPYFANQKYQLSGYSLPSLIVWQQPAPYYAIVDGAVVMYAKSEKRPEDTHLILPVCVEGEYSPQKLCDIARETEIPSYWFVSEDYVQRQSFDEIGRYFDYEEQPVFEDYIYLASDLAELKGNKFSKKRNLIHQFDRTHVDGGRVSAEAMTPEKADEYLEFLEKWCDEYLCDADADYDFTCEKQAVINMIKSIDLYDVRSLVIRIDGAVSAFGVCSHLNREMAVLNFEKAYNSIKGLYQYLDRECATLIYKNYKYINKESDMGLPGLAHSKNSYHPIGHVKSYRLTIKQPC